MEEGWSVEVEGVASVAITFGVTGPPAMELDSEASQRWANFWWSMLEPHLHRCAATCDDQ